MVRSLPFHGKNFGSSPCRATNGQWMWQGVATGLSIQGDGFDPRIDR